MVTEALREKGWLRATFLGGKWVGGGLKGKLFFWRGIFVGGRRCADGREGNPNVETRMTKSELADGSALKLDDQRDDCDAEDGGDSDHQGEAVAHFGADFGREFGGGDLATGFAVEGGEGADQEGAAGDSAGAAFNWGTASGALVGHEIDLLRFFSNLSKQNAPSPPPSPGGRGS
jgi:hypothetical protein